MIKIEVFEHKDWTQAKSDIANKKDRAKYKWCCTKIKLDGLFPRLPPLPPGFGIIHKNSQTCFEFLTIFWWILWNVHPHEKVICCLKDITLFQFFIGQSPYTSSVLKTHGHSMDLQIKNSKWISRSCSLDFLRTRQSRAYLTVLQSMDWTWLCAANEL